MSARTSFATETYLPGTSSSQAAESQQQIRQIRKLPQLCQLSDQGFLLFPQFRLFQFCYKLGEAQEKA